MKIGNVTFIFTYKGVEYLGNGKIEKNEKGQYSFNLKNLQTEKEEELIIKDYGKGSGNEHLVGTLEHKACMEFSITTYELVFGEPFKRKGVSNF